MIPFNRDIKTLDDVRAEYPKSFDMDLLKDPQVKKFYVEILKELIDDEVGMCELRGERCPSVTILQARFAPIAQAKAAYKLLWCGVHLGEQMLKYHWELKDMWTLIRRMQRAGQDPFSTEADTAAEFIESLEFFGRKRVVTKLGEEFFVYNPKGYDKQKIKQEEKTPYEEEEIWKSVTGYENYEVSNLGRVASRKKGYRLLMKLWEREDGYVSIRLYKHGSSKEYKIHRLVAGAFIPNPENRPQVNHMNGNKKDNRASNLEWATEKENRTHAVITGLMEYDNLTAKKHEQ